MRPALNRFLASALLLGLPVLGFAAPPSLMVVFNGNTEVNRHVFTFLGQVLKTPEGGGYQLTATLNPASLKPGTYKAVIVVSTKTTSGIDPTLAKFMKEYGAPQELYLLSLLSRSKTMAVTPFQASPDTFGVDGVTAATTWSRGSQQMHNQWMAELVAALAAR